MSHSIRTGGINRNPQVQPISTLPQSRIDRWLHPIADETVLRLVAPQSQQRLDRWAQVMTRAQSCDQINAQSQQPRNTDVRQNPQPSTIKKISTLNIATFNCPGLAAQTPTGRIKRRMLVRECRRRKVDIVAVQETHACASLSSLSSLFKWETYGSTYSARRGGVGFISFNKLIKITNPQDFNNGAVFSIDIEYEDRQMTLINIYAPRQGAQEQFFSQYLQTWNTQRELMFLGDWNFVENRNTDVVGLPEGETPKPPISFQRMKTQYQMFDVRNIKPPRNHITRWNTAYTVGRCLDRIYVNPLLRNLVVGMNNQAVIGRIPLSQRASISDHQMVMVKMVASTAKRGKGYWKMNTNLLKDPKFRTYIERMIRSFYRSEAIRYAPPRAYDILKARVRHGVREWSRRMNQQARGRTNHLRARIITLQVLMEKQTHVQQRLINELLQIQEELAEIEKNKAHGAWIRSRAKWDFQGEKCTKWYFNLEKIYQSRRTIKAIQKSTGPLTEDPNEITNEFRNYYKNLYSKRPIDARTLDFMLKKVQFSMSPELARDLSAPIRASEIARAIKRTKRGSSPGPDGLPSEFYRTFAHVYVPIFVRLYNHMATQRKAPLSFQGSYISLFPKKNKDSRKVENWRPIALLNTDYKILTKVWASRLGPIVAKTIGRHQTGFIPGRDIRENVLLVQTMLDRLKQTCQQQGILFLDLEKAYDRISQRAIYLVAKKFGFPRHGINFLVAIYRHAKAQVIHNGFQSRKFRIQSGVRQGCPLSPLLFTLVVEMLNQALIQSSRLRGFTINSTTSTKVVAYADDIAIPLSGVADLNVAQEKIELFEQATASKVNVKKTVCVVNHAQGPLTQALAKLQYTIIPPGNSFTYLGFSVGIDPDYDRIWTELETKVYRALNNWHQIGSSIYGRVLILKAKGLSQLWYQGSVIPITPHAIRILKNIQRKCRDFFWASKWHKLKEANLMLSTSKGGLKLWNITHKLIALQLKWMIKFEDPEYSALWKQNMAAILNQVQFQHNHPTPLSHSMRDWSQKIGSKIVANLQSLWSKYADRSPPRLKQGMWVTAFDQNEAPSFVYQVAETPKWEDEQVPNIKLWWYAQSDRMCPPQPWSEKAHALTQVRIRYQKHIIIEAVAFFDQISFLKTGRTGQIVTTSEITNARIYEAIVSCNNAKLPKPTRWTSVTEAQCEAAFTRNHSSGCGGMVKQFRWQILNHCLPVKGRLHYMGMIPTDNCPICMQIEDIRHRIQECYEVRRIIRWITTLWWRLTQEQLSPATDMKWVLNTHPSRYQKELAEIIDVCMYRAWLNRNQHVYRPQSAMPTGPLLLEIAKQLNVYIRAHRYIERIKQYGAVYPNIRPVTWSNWDRIWHQIQQLPQGDRGYAFLRATKAQEEVHSWLD